MVNLPGVTGSLPFLRTSLDSNQIRGDQAPATGSMSLPSSGHGGTTSVSTRQGDGGATQPSRSDATATWMRSRFEEGRPASSGFQIGSARSQPESGRAAETTASGGPKVQPEHYNNANLETVHYSGNEHGEWYTAETTSGSSKPEVQAEHHNNANLETIHYSGNEHGDEYIAETTSGSGKPKVQPEHYNNANLETVHYSGNEHGEWYTAETTSGSTTSSPSRGERAATSGQTVPADDKSMLTAGYIRI